MRPVFKIQLVKQQLLEVVEEMRIYPAKNGKEGQTDNAPQGLNGSLSLFPLATKVSSSFTPFHALRNNYLFQSQAFLAHPRPSLTGDRTR